MSGKNVIYAVEKLCFQNVVSLRKQIYYTELESFYKEFITKLVDNGYTIKGPYFYSLNSEVGNEIMDIELFMPIVENKFNCEGLQFQSYFEVNNLFTTVIKGNVAENAEQAYESILQAIVQNDLAIATPFYHVMSNTGSAYVNLYMGYFKETID